MTSNVEESPAVKVWLSRTAPSTALIYTYHFKNWLRWLGENGGEFAAMSPDELVAWQRSATREDEYRILDLIQAWVLGKNGQRKGTKENMFKAVKSFFMHNRAELPRDQSFKLRSEKPMVPNLLTVEEIRRVVLASNKTLRAAYMVMLGGGLDQESMVYWSNNGWPCLKKQLAEGKDPIKITIPGRKATKNDGEFSTYVTGDALEALKTHVKDRGDGDGPIFSNQFGEPISKSSLSDYWTRKLKELGIISRSGVQVERYGRGLHNLRDVFRTLWSQSGAAGQIAESMMGHVVDKLGYDRSFENEDYVKDQLEAATPFLNILTRGEAYGQVDKDEVKRLRRELAEARTGQNSEVAALRKQVEEMMPAFRMAQRMLDREMKLDRLTEAPKES
jgi:integrase